jgi:hypothetical protein
MMRSSLDNFSVLETLVHDIRFQTQDPNWPKLTVPRAVRTQYLAAQLDVDDKGMILWHSEPPRARRYVIIQNDKSALEAPDT